MKTKAIFITLLLATCLVNADTTEEVVEQNNIENAKTNEVLAQEDKIYQLLSSGSDPFSYGSSRGGSNSKSTLTPIDISNVSTSIKLKGLFKLDNENQSYALVQIGEERNARRQLVTKGDLILINENSKYSRTQSKSAKYLQIVEINENTVVIAPQMRPDEQIVIR